MRAGSPERGQPTLPRCKTPRRRWDRTLHHPTRVGGGPANQSRRQGRRGRVLWRVNPKKASTRRVLRDPVVRTNSRRDRSPGVDRVRTPPWGARRIDASNATRAGTSERGSDRREENALKGEAAGRSGAARCRQGRWWTSRWGCPNPGRDTQRGREAPRYAGPSFRHVSYGAKAQGRKHRPTGRPSGRRDGAGVLRWTSEGERKRKGGRRPEQSGSAGPGSREPGGRRNAVRVGRNPCASEWAGV
jgi:hypothetical protein